MGSVIAGTTAGRHTSVSEAAALVFPALFALDGTVGGLLNLRVLAGALAAVVAWRSESMLATIAVGMAVLWAGTFLLG